jgi:hypothetical protein
MYLFEVRICLCKLNFMISCELKEKSGHCLQSIDDLDNNPLCHDHPSSNGVVGGEPKKDTFTLSAQITDSG